MSIRPDGTHRRPEKRCKRPLFLHALSEVQKDANRSSRSVIQQNGSLTITKQVDGCSSEENVKKKNENSVPDTSSIYSINSTSANARKCFKDEEQSSEQHRCRTSHKEKNNVLNSVASNYDQSTPINRTKNTFVKETLRRTIVNKIDCNENCIETASGSTINDLQNSSSSNYTLSEEENNCTKDKYEQNNVKNVELANDFNFPIEQVEAISKLLEDTLECRIGSESQNVNIQSVVNNILKRHFPDCFVRVYGSYNSGYATEESDINLELVSEKENNFTIKFMNEVSKIINRVKPCFCVKFIPSDILLKNAYIRLLEPTNGSYCKIRCHPPNNKDFQTSELLRKLIKFDVRVKPLVFALRYWTEICHISSAEDGKIPPIGYVLMAIHFLQQLVPPVLPFVNTEFEEDGYVSCSLAKIRKANSLAVGELWLHLLEYYNFSFNWRNQVVSITSHAKVFKTDDAPWSKHWIVILDPLNPKVNIAKSVVNQDIFQYIQLCFTRAYEYFAKPTRYEATLTGDEKSMSSLDDGIESVSDVVEYNYTFSVLNFTDGIDITISCEECEERGFTCDDCAREAAYLPPMPMLTEKHKKLLDKVLEEAFETHMLQQVDVNKRLKIVSELEAYIKLRFPNAHLELMGSSLSGFGLKKSDLDICMTFKGYRIDEIDVKGRIKQLCHHLHRYKDFCFVFAIYSAKIPLVKFMHSKSRLRGDISLYNLLAVQNTKLLNVYRMIDKRAKILGCAAKLLAKNSGIADTAFRSLSSYSYVIMVIHFLQQIDPPILPALQELPQENTKPRVVEGCDVSFFNELHKLHTVWKHQRNNLSVGELWLQFLKYYTEDFDRQCVITIRSSKKPSEENPTGTTARLFNIQDPFIVSKNLGSVMSEAMSFRTSKILIRARKHFSQPVEQFPVGYKDYVEYFFDPMNLSDGQIRKAVECNYCGNIGHSSEKCVRFPNKAGRGRGHPRNVNTVTVNTARTVTVNTARTVTVNTARTVTVNVNI